ncbi:hypothetical protein PAPYR_3592 [Paratrimastix pyriformis]|uniref:Acylphosphatase-like domain-containing protein n=1 Tax=Paratrimastix pyriformis TaxID=342808 RepID=A0ABQ8UPJ6_9EUKA|nr:hypothetical protein PAPYR_3592 [Paratrimastix pyriformis]
MQKRGLVGGATNLKSDHNVVKLAMKGSSDKIEEILTFLRSGRAINNWGARATSVSEDPQDTTLLEEYQVTTANVDQHNWKKNVTFYL